MPRPFPASSVKVVRLYQARCPCGWSSEITDWQYVAQAGKRAHVEDHRKEAPDAT